MTNRLPENGNRYPGAGSDQNNQVTGKKTLVNGERNPVNKSPGEITINTNTPAGVSKKRRAASNSKKPSKKQRRASGRGGLMRWFKRIILLCLLAAGLFYAGRYEIRTSWLQSKIFSRIASSLHYQVSEGKAGKIIYPHQGPSDFRLGYTEMPHILDTLQKKGLVISSQSRFNDKLLQYAELGFYPPYKEKYQTGLQVFDAYGKDIYRKHNPERVYNKFTDIPYLMTDILLFIENRKLLTGRAPNLNPAIDWGRFAKAGVVYFGEKFNYNMPSMGGSTLATQIEKFRHSQSGITSSGEDKLIQMVSGSVRAYMQGEKTLEARERIVQTYLNAVPLAAAPGVGEVLGIGDGMYVWYGVEFNELNRLLSGKATPEEISGGRYITVLKQVVSLMIGHRRPSYYLFSGRAELESLTNSYLRLLMSSGIIDWKTGEEAQKTPLQFRDFSNSPALAHIENDKGANLVRNRLAPLFQTSVYNLDRMDLSVTSTLNIELQDKVNDYLLRIRQPDSAEEAGLVGKYLLDSSQVGDISYSFTLFEHSDEGNLVRVQTDTTKLAFDINEGSKLELGSTAKIRTLASYLEIIAETYNDLSTKSLSELISLEATYPDTLTRWTGNWLIENHEASLSETLNAAMNRQYSASPKEQFFTGGGVHTFNNFSKDDNGRIVTVRQAIENSINLPFIRIMHDIVNYTRAKQWENYRQVLQNDQDPRRKEVLDRFIDNESKVFLNRFWQKYKDKEPDQMLDELLAGLRPTPLRLAVVYRYLRPDADEESFRAFLQEYLPPETFAKVKVSTLYNKYNKDAFNLQDKGYLASVHPLELWLLEYMQTTPNPSFADAAEKSAEVRREVYGWLLKTRAKNARDIRIRTVLEVEAFSDIHRRWARLGYPFAHLVPSLATALGSSGDKPSSLAELMGIIINDGRRWPTIRLTQFDFARNTPYETTLKQPIIIPEQVMLPEVAQVLKTALSGVTSVGTARRLAKTFTYANGDIMTTGGKTGTGDNRIVVTRGGQKISSKARNRTATFVFYLGDHHFGTLTAFVTGNTAASYSFTSALPTQVLKSMAPILLPYLQAAEKVSKP